MFSIEHKQSMLSFHVILSFHKKKRLLEKTYKYSCFNVFIQSSKWKGLIVLGNLEFYVYEVSGNKKEVNPRMTLNKVL